MLNDCDSHRCDVSGEIYSGYDADCHDLGMEHCECGHEYEESFCVEHEPTVQEIREYLKRNVGHVYDHDDEELVKRFLETEGDVSLDDGEFAEIPRIVEELEYEVGVDMHKCPICQFQCLRHEDGLLFLMRKLDIKEDDLLREMREQSGGDYRKLQDHVNENFTSRVWHSW